MSDASSSAGAWAAGRLPRRQTARELLLQGHPCAQQDAGAGPRAAATTSIVARTRSCSVHQASGRRTSLIALGIAACQKGLAVRFGRAPPNLVHEMIEARDEKRLLRLQEPDRQGEPAHRRRARLRAPLTDRKRAAVRRLQPALRERRHHRHLKRCAASRDGQRSSPASASPARVPTASPTTSTGCR